MKGKLIGGGGTAAAVVGLGMSVWRLRTPLALAWDMWLVGTGAPSMITARQRRRLTDLVTFARLHSPYYRDRYQHVPAPITALSELLVVSKPELMTHFDAWVTDPQ
jgi:hypothetical protein